MSRPVIVSNLEAIEVEPRQDYLNSVETWVPGVIIEIVKVPRQPAESLRKQKNLDIHNPDTILKGYTKVADVEKHFSINIILWNRNAFWVVGGSFVGVNFLHTPFREGFC